MSHFVRLHIVGEGQTEEGFVKSVLKPHLANMNIFADIRMVQTSRDRKTGRINRGGLSSYAKARRDIISWLKQDRKPESRFSTMFDLYALPSDFPNYEEAYSKNDPYRKVEVLEQGLEDDISDPRFIPYIQLHEFEALIFSDIGKLLLEYFEYKPAIEELKQILETFNDDPEKIDDGEQTAPSRRILKNVPTYSKTTAGSIIAREIGIEKMREKCSHFNKWVSRLESLVC